MNTDLIHDPLKFKKKIFFICTKILTSNGTWHVALRYRKIEVRRKIFKEHWWIKMSDKEVSDRANHVKTKGYELLAKKAITK